MLDPMAELSYDFTPYRYGFNNPVFFSDASGLFENYGAAQSWIDKWGLSGAEISYNQYKGVYEIYNEGVSFYQRGEDIIKSMYSLDTDEIIFTITRGGAASGGGGFGDSFLGFSPSEIGILATGSGIYAGALQAVSESNANYQYKYASKTHTAKQLTEMNKTRMTKIANVSKVAGRNVGIFGSIVTAYQGATDGNGFTLGDGVKVGIGLITTFTPYGWIYGAIDMGVLIIHGTSLTDEIGNLIDSY